jgi:hypothetical protein
MNVRTAGDFDYDAGGGGGYAAARRTDPRIAALVHAALGQARTVLNVGAGAGSYEPWDRDVTAVEPSASMRSQRPAHLGPAIDATAEHLPFADASFDAAMAMVTVHQWADTDQGLRELRRVSRGPVVVLTFDGDALDLLWLADYVPELIAAERRRYPAIRHIREVLGGASTVTPVPVPADCVDGFTEAYYARPERFLDPAVRQSSPRGASSRRPPSIGASPGCAPTWTQERGTAATEPSGRSRNSPDRSGSSPPSPADQSLGGHAGIWPRPDGNRMFFERTNSCSVSTAFSRPKPLPFTPPNGEPRKARRM